MRLAGCWPPPVPSPVPAGGCGACSVAAATAIPPSGHSWVPRWRRARVELTARELADITRGAVVAGDPDARATSFTIDSRRLEPGACFVALIAERDGHDYVDDARARGARVAMVTRDVPHTDLAVVRVDDAFAALARIGRVARDALDDAVVVGITGSAGKPGTKDPGAPAPTPKVGVD